MGGTAVALCQSSSKASQASVGTWITGHRVYVPELVRRAAHCARRTLLEVGDSVDTLAGLADRQTCASSAD